MACSPNIRISKYFGTASIQKMVMSLEESREYLQYFWTPEGGHNIIISIDGQTLKSYEDLLKIASDEKYKNRDTIDIGLHLSNDGSKSIWPSRP